MSALTAADNASHIGGPKCAAIVVNPPLRLFPQSLIPAGAALKGGSTLSIQFLDTPFHLGKVASGPGWIPRSFYVVKPGRKTG